MPQMLSDAGGEPHPSCDSGEDDWRRPPFPANAPQTPGLVPKEEVVGKQTGRGLYVLKMDVTDVPGRRIRKNRQESDEGYRQRDGPKVSGPRPHHPPDKPGQLVANSTRFGRHDGFIDAAVRLGCGRCYPGDESPPDPGACCGRSLLA